jgi:hypothetical protein
MGAVPAKTKRACGACLDCEVALVQQYHSKERHGGQQLPTHPLEHLRAHADDLSEETGIPSDEIIELFCFGRTDEDILDLVEPQTIQ